MPGWNDATISGKMVVRSAADTQWVELPGDWPWARCSLGKIPAMNTRITAPCPIAGAAMNAKMQVGTTAQALVWNAHATEGVCLITDPRARSYRLRIVPPQPPLPTSRATGLRDKPVGLQDQQSGDRMPQIVIDFRIHCRYNIVTKGGFPARLLAAQADSREPQP